MKINDSIKHLVLPLEKLIPLDGNPRRGNIDAITSSYREFGQVKPIVVRPNGDGTFTVIAGNHQVQAAKKLGWVEIAAVQMNEDDKTAAAFAIADNRTSELGSVDVVDLMSFVSEIKDDFPSLIEDLGWDDFEFAAMEEWTTQNSETDEPRGYVAPVIVQPIDNENTEDTLLHVSPNPIDLDDKDTVTRGAASASTTQKSIVQYTLVFDSSDQQRKWYDFVRYLRSSAVYSGDTTASKIIDFIESHAEF